MRRITFFLLVPAILVLLSCQKEPAASFTMSATSVSVGDAVTFTNTSTDASSFVWDFGDGSQETIENPTHVYTSSGSYTVSLEVTSENGKKNSTATNTLLVIDAGDFSYAPMPTYIDTDITFTDLSANSPVSWLWTFGDGGSSTQQNPVHSFASTGTYAVTLEATGAAGVATVTKNIILTNAANFLAGSYIASDSTVNGIINYADYVTASGSVNNRVTVGKFGAYSGANVYIDISGNTISVPAQTVTCGTPSGVHTVAGTGTISGNTFFIYYTDTYESVVYYGKVTYVKS